MIVQESKLIYFIRKNTYIYSKGNNGNLGHTTVLTCTCSMHTPLMYVRVIPGFVTGVRQRGRELFRLHHQEKGIVKNITQPFDTSELNL